MTELEERLLKRIGELERDRDRYRRLAAYMTAERDKLILDPPDRTEPWRRRLDEAESMLRRWSGAKTGQGEQGLIYLAIRLKLFRMQQILFAKFRRWRHRFV